MIGETSKRMSRNSSIKVRNEPLIGIVENAQKLRLSGQEFKDQEKRNEISLDELSKRDVSIFHRQTSI